MIIREARWGKEWPALICQECMKDRYKGYTMKIDGLVDYSFFICDECLNKAKKANR